MSTPRRSWPRSMGTPKIPTGRRTFSNKRHTPGASRIGRGFEWSLRCAPHGVDPAEVHRGLLVDEHLLVAVEVVRGGAGRSQSYEATLCGGEDRWAHAGDQSLPRHQRMEAFRVQLRLTQSVIHWD